jgi:hypothetical protein
MQVWQLTIEASPVKKSAAGTGAQPRELSSNPESHKSKCLQKSDQVGFFLIGETNAEALIVEIHDVLERGS